MNNNATGSDLPFMYRVPYGSTRAGGVVKSGLAGTMSSRAHEANELLFEPTMNKTYAIQKNGDRGAGGWSASAERAYCLPANPMSDRGQMLLEEPRVLQVARFDSGDKGWDNPQTSRIYSAAGLAPTCCTSLPVNVLEDKANSEATAAYLLRLAAAGARATVDVFPDGAVLPHGEPRYRVRKLTPRECFRLMDVRDEDIDKIQAAGVSRSQQYHMAGNSIVVGVLEDILGELLFARAEESPVRSLFEEEGL